MTIGIWRCLKEIVLLCQAIGRGPGLLEVFRKPQRINAKRQNLANAHEQLPRLAGGTILIPGGAARQNTRRIKIGSRFQKVNPWRSKWQIPWSSQRWTSIAAL